VAGSRTFSAAGAGFYAPSKYRLSQTFGSSSFGDGAGAIVSGYRLLRDIFINQCDYEKAGALQKELVECRSPRLSAAHLDTLAARADLAAMLLKTAASAAG